MNRILKIIAVLAVFAGAGVFVNPVIARRYDTSLVGYDRWIAEDYRYESWNTPENYTVEPIDIRDSRRDVEFSVGGTLDPVGAIFGVFNWITESVGSVFGAEVSDPYEANP